MTETRIYDYALKAHGSGYEMEDGTRLERVTETDVLHAMMLEVTACNKAKGWHDVNPRLVAFMEWIAEQNYYLHPNVIEMLNQMLGPRTFGDDIALLHSEVSEMLEAHRDGRMAVGYEYRPHDSTRILDIDSEWPPTHEQMLAAGYDAKPVGMPTEAADVLVRLLDTCYRYDIDLFAEWRRKVNYNWTRPIRHGNKAL